MLDDMFQRLAARVAAAPATDISKAIGVEMDTYSDMQNAIRLWSDMYSDYSPWLFTPGHTLQSLNLPAAIAGEFARLVTAELESKISGSPRADFLDQQYQSVLSVLRQQVEYGCAKGGIIFKPYISNRQVLVDYIQADCFHPTAFDSSGRMTGVVFADTITRGRKIFTRLEYHRLEKNKYTITNKAYAADSYGQRIGILGTQIPLSDVPEWSDIQPETTISNVDRLLIGYFKVPFANTIDTHSPLGVSVYSRATDLIKAADEQYSRTMWEYEGSELAVYVSEDALKLHGNGQMSVPRLQDRLMRGLSIDAGEKDFFSEFSPAIRDASLFNGLNNLLRRIEFQCSLAYGTLSDPENVDKTAEEIKTSKQRSYSAVSDIQKSLESALNDLISAMDILTTLYRLAPTGAYETSYNWDDSIIVDASSERLQDKEDVRDGIMPKWEYRMKWYGEDEKTAREMVEDTQSDDEVMGFVDSGTA